jgi:uncharacterized membrane protein HdeD (DUF308 family)
MNKDVLQVVVFAAVDGVALLCGGIKNIASQFQRISSNHKFIFKSISLTACGL